MECEKLIDKLNHGCIIQYIPDGLENTEVNTQETDAIMREASSMLQSVFDPENQPSQFGTVFMDEALKHGTQGLRVKVTEENGRPEVWLVFKPKGVSAEAILNMTAYAENHKGPIIRQVIDHWNNQQIATAKGVT